MGQDHPSSLGPVPWIVSTLQCHQSVVSVLVGLKAGAGLIEARLFQADFWTSVGIIRNDSRCPEGEREWTELDGTAVSRRSVAQVRVNSGDPGPCPKICLKEPGLNKTSAGFQTDENRYYTLILAEKAEKR
ncbi:hypothetical protein I4U23_025421 [Adineta vaga]|nr:hypothetical protein I4U23_025421 [Adineta vaga]